jgi:hypothetical protein
MSVPSLIVSLIYLNAQPLPRSPETFKPREYGVCAVRGYVEATSCRVMDVRAAELAIGTQLLA